MVFFAFAGGSGGGAALVTNRLPEAKAAINPTRSAAARTKEVNDSAKLRAWRRLFIINSPECISQTHQKNGVGRRTCAQLTDGAPVTQSVRLRRKLTVCVTSFGDCHSGLVVEPTAARTI